MARRNKTGLMAQVVDNNAGLLTINDATDVINEELIVTAGYFTDAVATLRSSSFHTASIEDSNEHYYFGIANKHATSASVATQLDVAYGHYAGSGSYSGSVDRGQTEAIYKQWAEILLPDSEITGGFKISSPASNGAVAGTGKDESIYVLTAKRSLMKDAVNRKNWTIHLSGSDASSPGGGGAKSLYLTDDSDSTNGTPTPYGIRFNIVSGSQGTVVSASTAKNFGWFYPNLGVWVFSGAELSQSIGGETPTSAAVVASSGSQLGFATNGGGNVNEKNALRFVNCLNHDMTGTGASGTAGGGYITLRNEEVQNSTSYFCRVRAPFMNFSTNPTFVSGALNQIRNQSMWNNPTVYITRVGLYNEFGEVVAVAALSKPLKKNYQSEATIKVKLTY